MATFMLESGRLAPAARTDGIPDGFSEQWCALVRPEVLELTDTAAFAVAWNGSRAPVLTAMGADGAALAVAVLPRLDLVTLAELIAVAGRARMSPWAQVAAQYPRGTAAFRRDWNTFRETSPQPTAPLPTLVVVAGSVSEQVMWSLPLLDQVRIVRAQVRRGPGDSHLLDLTAISPADATRPPRAAAPGAPAVPGAPAAPGTPAERTPPHQAATGAGVRTGSPEGSQRPDGGSQQTGPEVVLTGAESRARTAAPARTASRARSAERGAGMAPRTAPTAHTVPSPADPADREALELVASMVQAPASIELRHDQTRHRATLNSGGVVVLPDGTQYTDLGQACADLVGADHPDPWASWRFTDGQFPLADARAEALRHRADGHTKRNGAATGRRARS